MFEHNIILRTSVEFLIKLAVVIMVFRNHAAFLHHLANMIHLVATLLYFIFSLGSKTSGADHAFQSQLVCKFDTFSQAGIIRNFFPGEMTTCSLETCIVGDLFKFLARIPDQRSERSLVTFGTAPFYIFVAIVCESAHRLMRFLRNLFPEHIRLKANGHVDAFTVLDGKDGGGN